MSKKWTGFTATTTLADADIGAAVVSPDTTPANRKITWLNIANYIAGKFGYVIADKRFSSPQFFGDALDAQFSGRVNILIGASQAGLQIKQSTEDSFSFFEFFSPGGSQLATLNESGNLSIANDATIGGTLTGGTVVAGNGGNGTFLSADAKTVTVQDGIITSIA